MRLNIAAKSCGGRGLLGKWHRRNVVVASAGGGQGCGCEAGLVGLARIGVDFGVLLEGGAESTLVIEVLSGDAGADAAEYLVGDGLGEFCESWEAIGCGRVVAEEFYGGVDVDEIFGDVGEVDDDLVHGDAADNGCVEPCFVVGRGWLVFGCGEGDIALGCDLGGRLVNGWGDVVLDSDDSFV